MEYIKIKFGSDFNTVRSSYKETFEEMFRTLNTGFSLCDRAWTPPMDIYETPDEIIVRAEIAGVVKEDLELEINNKAVRIYGRRCEMSRQDNATYRLAEIQYGTFERILFLPSPIDTEIVSASYLNGFLQIRLARLRTDAVHKIPISDQ